MPNWLELMGPRTVMTVRSVEPFSRGKQARVTAEPDAILRNDRLCNRAPRFWEYAFMLVMNELFPRYI